jgi:ribosomal protein S18 acetylase RimI-like enzyme
MPARPLSNVPQVTVRPIRASDKDALLDLFERLSSRSRLRRFLAPKPSLSRREVAYLTEVDHRTHEALVAVGPDGGFVGVGRYACGIGQTDVADVAFAVADGWQGRGIGTTLAGMIAEIARENGITRLQAMTLPENGPARKLLGRLGFEVRGIADGVLEVELDLAAFAAERDAPARRAA